ncbi:hypothetical protein AB5I41_24100 [Sphingomonas sp. MMS24-JH45]
MLDLYHPAVMMRLAGKRLVPEASNRAFARGLALRSTPIADFLEFGEAQRDIDWQAGAAVERRHYRVTLARLDHRLELVMISFVDQTAEAAPRTRCGAKWRPTA